MSDEVHEEGAVGAHDEGAESETEEADKNYTVPVKMSAKEILQADQDDPSLENYKKQLLGGAAHVTGEPTKVVLKKLSFISLDDDKRIELDPVIIMNGEKVPSFRIKEGVKYKIECQFIVENDIVTGLNYFHNVKRKGVPFGVKERHMMGSFGPNATEVKTQTIYENEMPKGMVARGHYSVSSQFADDDKNVYLKWDWSFDLSKGWDSDKE